MILNIFKSSLILYFLTWTRPPGCRWGKQQRAHARNPGEAAQGEEGPAQPDEGRGWRKFFLSFFAQLDEGGECNFFSFTFCSTGWRGRLQNQFLSFFGLIRWRESLQNQFVDQCDRTNRFFSEREPPGVDLCAGRDVFSLHWNRQDLNAWQPPSRRVTCKWRKCFFSPRAPRSLVMTSFYVFSWTRILQGFNRLPRTSQPAPKRRFLLKHIFKLHACWL